jgi:3-hydroxybutyryl-CoA dehydrogenase
MQEFSRAIGKTPVDVKDSPGFIVNRVLIPMINEAAFLCMEGVAKPEHIDSALCFGANHPIGL